MNSNWLETNTFHHSEFSDLEQLVAAKKNRGLSISLCFPTLNEEKTIAKEIVIMKSELMIRFPLLDEIIVIDSGSTDRTREIARSYGVSVYEADHILPELGTYRGKGENLWKALYVTCGDIIVYIDADIKNIHHRFAYGLLGPLLCTDHIRFSKAFYDRPFAVGTRKMRPTGGGRVTELVVRPLFSLFMPELTQLLQPLSGEYAGYRKLFANIPFPIGYGVETGMILEIYKKWGLGVMAQVDLDRRIHKHQDTKALGLMAFTIMKTLLRRLQTYGQIQFGQPILNEMIQYSVRDSQFHADIKQFHDTERPPMESIEPYRKRFKLEARQHGDLGQS